MNTSAISNTDWVKQLALLAIASLLCVFGLMRVSQIMTQTTPHQTLNRSVLVMSDEKRDYSITQVVKLEDSNWQVRQLDNLSFGIHSGALWLKVELPRLDIHNQWLLEIDHPILDKVDVWFVAEDTVLSEYHGGDGFPFDFRDLNHEKFLFSVPNETQQTLTLILKIHSDNSVILPLKIWKEQNYLLHNGEYSLGLGLFFGLLLTMGLSSFFFYITTGSVNFLYYCGYAICVCATLSSLQGIAFKYVWPSFPWVQQHAALFFSNALMYFAAIFSRHFLELKKHSIILDKLLGWTAILFVLSGLVSLILPYHLMIVVYFGCLSFTTVLFLVCVYQLRATSTYVAKVYSFAWLSLLLCILIAIADRLAWIQVRVDSKNLIMLAASFETILLALILAFNYSKQQSELEQTQRNAKKDLEYKVEERTLELQIALRELSETNRELEERNTLDALTGIKNRRFFDKRLLAEIRRCRREQTPLTLALLDIDHFKQVNDTYGHLVGDACLKHIANIMVDVLKRPQDEVCRYGGEEFAIILPNTEQSGAEMVLESIRQSIEQSPMVSDPVTVDMTISIGLTTLAPSGSEVTENQLIEAADKALYKAKETGRNKVVAVPFPLNTSLS